MFTSLRLGVTWRTEQLIYYYIKMTWASAVCYCQATWFRVGDRVHLERDCISHVIRLYLVPLPPYPKMMTGDGQLTRGAFIINDFLRNPHFSINHFIGFVLFKSCIYFLENN